MADASKASPQGVERLGYLGLGLMGTPMTRRLLEAGYHVSCLEPFGRQGRSARRGRRQARSHAPRHVGELGHRLHVRDRCRRRRRGDVRARRSCSGFRRRQARRRFLVDPSRRRARSAARLKDANGAGWIDAPVSGGTKGAEEGTLAIMAGGEAADIERARPYVLAMARRFTHMGPTGAGQTTKLCNQVIVGCAMAVLAEATRLASNAGIDAGRLPEALAGGFADFIPLQLFVPRMVQGIHSPPLGHVATMLKDLDTVADVARRRQRRCRWRPSRDRYSGWPRLHAAPTRTLWKSTSSRPQTAEPTSVLESPYGDFLRSSSARNRPYSPRANSSGSLAL